MNHSKPKTNRFENTCHEAELFADAKTRKHRLVSDWCCVGLSMVVCFVMIIGACATHFERPGPFDNTDLRHRAQTIVEDSIRVSAAVPDLEESRAIFGVNLEGKNIEPLWLEIENNTDRQIYFLESGLDPEYFSPREVSFGFHKVFSKSTNKQIDNHIESLGFHNIINPHSTSSGFVFTNSDEGSKFVSVDLIGREWTKSFTLIVPTPSRKLPVDRYSRVSRMIASSEMIEVKDEARLRELLEKLPCCTSSKDGVQGEPLNIALIGDILDISAAFVRRNYRYSPVAPKYVFQRQQDVSVSKRDRWVAAQPQVLRAWLTTIRFQDKPVWIGQISSPFGGRFARVTEEGKDEYIEPFVDEARNNLVQDIVYSQSLLKMGFVKGVGRVMASTPRKLPSGATYHTDGLRAVLLFEKRPVSLSEIEFFRWERLVDHYRQQLDGGE
jgi:hypothetical protein